MSNEKRGNPRNESYTMEIGSKVIVVDAANSHVGVVTEMNYPGITVAAIMEDMSIVTDTVPENIVYHYNEERAKDIGVPKMVDEKLEEMKVAILEQEEVA